MSIINLGNLTNKMGNYNEIKKNSGFMENTLIEYSDDEFSSEFEEIMKKGYEEMAEINLEYSELGAEYMLDDVDEYEAWICGV